MGKVIRNGLLVILGLILLLVAGLVVAMLVIDPNDYKPRIEGLVEQNTNLDLELQGELGWSFIPIGLRINQVSASLEQQPFASLDTLVAEVDLWSLIALSPRVDRFLLEGLSANLVRDAQGQGNWERIMPEPKETPAGAEPPPEPRPSPESAPAPGPEPSAQEPLQFQVNSVRIADASIRFEDQASDQVVNLEGFNLDARDIALGRAFPLNLDFNLATSQPQMTVEANLSARLTASEDLKTFTVEGLDSGFQLSGEPLHGQTVEAGLRGNLLANLDTETASLKNFRVSLADLKLSTDLEVQGFGPKPKLTGTLTLAEFSPRKLLEQLGQPPIETTDPGVLQAVALNTDIGGQPGRIELNNFTLRLDDTQFAGKLAYGLEDSFIGVDLQGDQLNVDRYLPPPADKPESAASGKKPGTPSAGTTEKTAAHPTPEEPPLLPLETLRKLAFEARLGLEKLVASKLTITGIGIEASGKDGLIDLKTFQADLYDGQVQASAQLDARTDNPQWTVSKSIEGVQIKPLLTDLAEVALLSGATHLTADLKTTGNRISALRQNAHGQAEFRLQDGAFETVNFNKLACQGIAALRGETLSTDWPPHTPFDKVTGKLIIDGNRIRNERLVAGLRSLQLHGQGTVDLKAQALDYRAGLKIVDEIADDRACRIDDEIMKLEIPIRCRGSLTAEPGSLCSFDRSRFKDVILSYGKSRAKEEIKKEARDFIDDKLGEELKDELGNEGAKQIQDTLKGLFN